MSTLILLLFLCAPADASWMTGDPSKVLKSSDTMTGPLTILPATTDNYALAIATGGSSAFALNVATTGVTIINGDVGGLQITSGTVNGTVIKFHTTATASLDFGAVAGVTCSELNVTVTGALDGDVCGLGIPNALATTQGLQFSCWVSATNTVTVNACCSNGETLGIAAACANPAAATVRASVWRY